MAVIAVVNRKGGTGKSTIATHVASYLATQGHEVMLGDVDRQQSSRLWLGLRPEARPRIHGWTIDERNFARPPAGVKHVVLDTPGGFQGIGLMKVAQYADAILIPSTASLFDRRAAADCVQELRAFPRVQTAKCTLASLGMRIDGRTRNAEVVAAWAAEQGLEHLGTIREAQVYARCLEQGLSIFDFPPNRSIAGFVAEWARIGAWIEAAIERAAAAQAEAAVVAGTPGTFTPRPSILSAALAQRKAEAAANAEVDKPAPGLIQKPAFLRA